MTDEWEMSYGLIKQKQEEILSQQSICISLSAWVVTVTAPQMFHDRTYRPCQIPPTLHLEIIFLFSPSDSTLPSVLGQTDVRVGARPGLVTTKHRNLEMSEIQKNLPEKLTSCLLIRLLAVLAMFV